MNRREFLKCSGVCAGAGVTGFSLAGSAAAGQQAPPSPPSAKPGAAPGAQTPQARRREFDFEIEIVEGKCQPHQAGQKFKFPDEKGKICPWLMDSMNGAIRVLEYGGTMPWLYTARPTRKSSTRRA